MLQLYMPAHCNATERFVVISICTASHFYGLAIYFSDTVFSVL
jgi:hypothetical protein